MENTEYGPLTWSQDGRFIFFIRRVPQGAYGIVKIPAERGGPPTVVLEAKKIDWFAMNSDASRFAIQDAEDLQELWSIENITLALK